MNQPLGIEGPDLLALNVFMEARGEPDEGRAAVAQVTLNRTKSKYQSDGSIEGTVLGDNQFSWTQWGMVGGHYHKLAFTPEAEAERVREAYSAALKAPEWVACKLIADQVIAGTFTGPGFRLLTPKTVLYYNPKAVEKDPDWAQPSKLDCVIGHHWFFHS